MSFSDILVWQKSSISAPSLARNISQDCYWAYSNGKNIKYYTCTSRQIKKSIFRRSCYNYFSMGAEHLQKTLSGHSVTGNKLQSKAESFIDSLQPNGKMSSSYQIFQYTLVVLLLPDKKWAPWSWVAPVLQRDGALLNCARILWNSAPEGRWAKSTKEAGRNQSPQ